MSTYTAENTRGTTTGLGQSSPVEKQPMQHRADGTGAWKSFPLEKFVIIH